MEEEKKTSKLIDPEGFMENLTNVTEVVTCFF